MFNRLSSAMFCALACSAWGSNFSMDPWILIFEPQKKILTQVVTFTYQGGPRKDPSAQSGPLPSAMDNAPVPVEITIPGREVTLDGKLSYPASQAGNDFVVYPSQLILYPGDSKKVQVQWVGETLPDKEISLGFIATQLPLKLNDKLDQPKRPVGVMLMQARYEGVIVVRPANVKPRVVVDTAYYRNDSTGTNLVTVLENKGTGLQPLRNMELAIAPLDKAGKPALSQRTTVKVKSDSPAITQSLFAGFKRMVVAPWPPGFPVGPVNVTPIFPESPK
ncbi:MAG: hypothetical protein JWO30_3482 [Fibrobacteres bacterium]|nr:hypothetical protein [Fibrobacterota bacterium]